MLIREQALRAALRELQLGVHEIPSGSNWGPRIRLYLRSVNIDYPAPWCMAFVNWCYAVAGHKLPYPTASVGNFLQWATRAGDIVQRPLRGDLICYRWDADDWPDHVGFVEKVLALRWRGKAFVGWVKTVEGNSHDRVERRYRWVSRVSFVRIPGSI